VPGTVTCFKALCVRKKGQKPVLADQERIRRIAHRIWEEAGRPMGRAALHWEMAEKEAEDAERAKAPPAEPDPKLPVLTSEPMV
jgi:Protein of unknown function (DUF2934)